MATISLSAQLRALRESNGYTQEYISSQLHIERAAYSNYELGKRTPAPELIVDFAIFYDITTDELLRHGNIPTRKAHEKETIRLSPTEQRILSLYRSLSERAREEIADYMVFKSRSVDK